MGGCQPTAAWRWERAEAGLPRQTVILALAVDPADPGRLWTGYYAPGGLGTSQDGGQTWSAGGQGLGDNPIFDLLALEGDQIYAAVRDGLFRSGDGGTTWATVSNALPPAPTFALAADGTGRLYVGLDDRGLYVGEPDGGNWTPLATEDTQPDLATAGVVSVAISPDGAGIYAGTAGRGLFASRDGGGTWTAAFPATARSSACATSSSPPRRSAGWTRPSPA